MENKPNLDRLIRLNTETAGWFASFSIKTTVVFVLHLLSNWFYDQFVDLEHDVNK
jgi:hypothetical protein